MKRIAIHSVPRSGSTWLGEIFNSHPSVNYNYQPLFSYAFKGYLTPHSELNDIVSFYEKIAQSDDEFINQSEARNGNKLPIFKKEHKYNTVVYKEVRYHNIIRNLLLKDEQIIIIGLIRNPIATIHSWLKAPREFRKDLGWDENLEWRFAPKKNMNKPEEYNGFEKWKETTFLFEKLQTEFPERFKIIVYNNLLKNTISEVKEMFNFCGLPMHKNTLQFLESSMSHNNINSYSVFKVKKDDKKWVDNLSPDIIESITKELKGSSLEKYLT